MAGYSGKPLTEKLGIKSGQRIHFAHAPENYAQTLGELPVQVVVVKSLKGPCDLIQFFTRERAELEEAFPRLRQNLAANGSLWISWPKAASKIKTDLNENVAREIGLRNGLVDVRYAPWMKSGRD